MREGEGKNVEFKSTLRVNLHTEKRDPRMEHSCLKTLAAFMNSQGGTLVIGVADDGTLLGIENDGFKNEDQMGLHLANLVNDRMGPKCWNYLHPRFEDQDGKRVLVVDAWKAKAPVFMKDEKVERFYIRGGPSTIELPGGQVQEYIKARFDG